MEMVLQHLESPQGLGSDIHTIYQKLMYMYTKSFLPNTQGKKSIYDVWKIIYLHQLYYYI